MLLVVRALRVVPGKAAGRVRIGQIRARSAAAAWGRAVRP